MRNLRTPRALRLLCAASSAIAIPCGLRHRLNLVAVGISSSISHCQLYLLALADGQ